MKKILMALLLVTGLFSLNNTALTSINNANEKHVNHEIKRMNPIGGTIETSEEVLFNFSNLNNEVGTNSKVVIVDDENPDGVVICSIRDLAGEYGTNSKVVIVDDENPDGVVICTIGNLVNEYGVNSKVVIVDDENPDGVVICSTGELGDNASMIIVRSKHDYM